MAKREIVDVSPEFRTNVFEIARRLGIAPDDIVRPNPTLKRAGLLPPMTWVSVASQFYQKSCSGASCVYDARLVFPWVEENRGRIVALLQQAKEKAAAAHRETGNKLRARKKAAPSLMGIEGPSRPTAGGVAALRKCSERLPPRIEDDGAPIEDIDVVEVAGRTSNFGCPELRRRPLGPRSLPVAHSDWLAPITRAQLMSSR